MAGAITLWGRKTSSNVQKVVWALAELGLDYEHVPLGGRFGGLDAPEYRQLNPNGLVPTLRDGDLVLWESHAILRYLAATYGAGSLWPVEAQQRALVDQWTDWTATTFQPAWIKVFWQVVRTAPEKQHRGEIERAVADTAHQLGIMDRQLAERPFLAGDTLSYADLAAGVALFRWHTMEIARPELGNVRGYYDRLTERPAYQLGVMVSYEELRARSAY
jgi:glutathione S-transferase